MEQLYLIGLGGNTPGVNSELHDMRLVCATSLEDAFQQVQKTWYGTTLHIDSYTVVESVRDHVIDYTKQAEKQLYLIVYGGYQKGTIDELHQYDLILADSSKEAKQIAKANIDEFPPMDHIDNIVAVSEQSNCTFGFTPATTSFAENKTVHKFIRLIES